MKTTITYNEFANTFLTSGSYETKFSREGLSALFDYFEELEESTGEEIEFDMVGIACDFTEYDNLNDYNEQNGTEYASLEDMQVDGVDVIQSDHQDSVMRDTGCTHSFIIQNF
jgi:hypothetical protein